MRLASRWMVCLLALFIIVAFLGAFHRQSVGHLVQSTTSSVLDSLPLGVKPAAGGEAGEAASAQPPTDDTPASSSTPPASQSPTEQPQQSSAPPAPTDVRSFWRKWSAAMARARPDCPDISLQGQARTLAPAEGATHRMLAHEFVHNSNTDLAALHAAHARFVDDLRANLSEEDAGVFRGGRGVVMVGGGEYFGPAIVSIYMLRRTGSTLPVEVFVPDYGEYETQVCEGYLRRLNAECRVLSNIWGVAKEKRAGKKQQHGEGLPPIQHYQLKAAALLLSSFSEVLLLDSDSMPLMDPAKLFDAPPFQAGGPESGLLLWPDFWAATESPRFWTNVVGFLDFPDSLPATSSETGQLLVDKRTHLAPLLLATYYNVYGRSHYYHLLSQGALGEGDKETFMAAAVALNATYHRVETGVVALSRFDGEKKRGTAMVQHAPGAGSKNASKGGLASPAFLHCNTPKMNAGHLIDEGDLVAKDDGLLRLRLLGPAEEQEERFGYDIEGVLWDLLVQTGCELASVIQEWQHRERMCERLTEARELITGRTGPMDEASKTKTRARQKWRQ